MFELLHIIVDSSPVIITKIISCAALESLSRLHWTLQEGQDPLCRQARQRVVVAIDLFLEDGRCMLTTRSECLGRDSVVATPLAFMKFVHLWRTTLLGKFPRVTFCRQAFNIYKGFLCRSIRHWLPVLATVIQVRCGFMISPIIYYVDNPLPVDRYHVVELRASYHAVAASTVRRSHQIAVCCMYTSSTDRCCRTDCNWYLVVLVHHHRFSC